jgi:hypothetical protein
LQIRKQASRFVTAHPAVWTTMGGAERAREMWDAGAHTAVIGRAVGTTSDAIVGYAHRHGWGPHPRPPPRPAPPPAPAVAAPKPPRGPRREACNPAPLAVPTRRFHGCQWITGDDRRTWRFCDAPVVPQSVYCADHYGRCYYRPRWHAEVAA